MKLLLALMTLLSLLACAPSPNGPAKSRSFLIAGQSNAVSLARNLAPQSSQTGFTFINQHNAQGDFDIPGPFTSPTNENPTSVSISWLYLGDLFHIPTYFFNVAKGGTGIVEWRDSLYTRILDALKITQFDAILWVQGETDVYQNTDQITYYNSLKTIIEQTRVVAPNTPWYIAINSDGPPNNPVRLAQQQLIDEGYALAGPDTDSIRNNPNWVDSIHQHFINEGLHVHAALWYDVLKAYDNR